MTRHWRRSSGSTADNVGATTRFFARRCVDPQLVGDLTADTFVRAMTSFATFDAARGSAASWCAGSADGVS
ncbi:sigma factor [Lentzea sp. NPDC006480]|uniref:sigma factor n=1 Tax=Lentzea sp. NPDC006480 TaxID=3157176 RepID=UPI0033AEBE0F